MRAGGPERGEPTLPRRKTPRRRWDRTSHHPTREGGGPANQSRRTGRRGGVLWRVQPREGSHASGPSGSDGQQVFASGSKPWSRPRPHAPLGGEANRREQRHEGRDLREEIRSTRGERLEGVSRWTLRRRKASAGTVVDAAMGVPKPRTRHAAGPGGSALRGSAVPACVVRRESPGEEASSDGRPSGRRVGAGVLRWTSEGERKRKGGRRPEQSGSAGLGSREPGGRRNAVRVGRNPCASEWAGV
jgi:hypothetical protein